MDPRGGCLDEHLVAALADGTLPRDAHMALLPHLTSCAPCLSAVAAVTATLAAADVRRELAALETRRSRRLRFLVPAAAAAVLLVSLPRVFSEPDPHRGAAVTAGDLPVAVSPAGDAASGAPLVWLSWPGARVYRVVLFGGSGEVLFEHVTGDTTTVVPDSITLVPGREYLWRVDAQVGWNRWTSSELLTFRVLPLHGP